MYTVGLNHDSHREVVAALTRAERAPATVVQHTSDLVKLAAVVCIGAGVMLPGLAVLVALTALGSAALWLSFHHDDTVVERSIESMFDRRTGLPLEQGLETVLSDEMMAGSLSGRFAVVLIDVPEIAAREVSNDHGAAEALMVSITHRLQGHGWVGSNNGPFSPLVFLRRPGVFVVVLRDVIDDHTTRWLAGRLLEIVNEPVRWDGAQLDPRAVIGMAVGSASERLDLVRQAGEARCRARRDLPGAIVCGADSEASAVGTAVVAVADVELPGQLIDPPSAGGELFGEAAAFLRSLDDAFELARSTGERCFVRANSVALRHSATPARIAARVNAAGLHGRVGIVVSPELVTGRGTARDSVEQVRRCGLNVYVDASDGGARGEWRAFDGFVDGVVVSGAAVAEQPSDDTSALDEAERAWAKRTFDEGRMAQYPKAFVTSAR